MSPSFTPTWWAENVDFQVRQGGGGGAGSIDRRSWFLRTAVRVTWRTLPVISSSFRIIQRIQLSCVLFWPTETGLCVPELALYPPERMFNLGSRSSLGLLDLANHATQKMKFSKRILCAAVNLIRPCYFVEVLLWTFFNTGVAGIRVGINNLRCEQFLEMTGI